MSMCKDCKYGIDTGCYDYLECFYMPPTASKRGGNSTYKGNAVRPMVYRNSMCGMFELKPQKNEAEKTPNNNASLKNLLLWIKNIIGKFIRRG